MSACCIAPDAPAPSPPATTPAPAPSVEPAPGLAVGTPVLAAWHGGHFWFAAVVVGTEGSMLRVLYVDGTSEALPPTAVTEDRMGPGTSIDTHQIDQDEWYGAVIQQRVGHALRVDYADGRQMWTGLGLARIDSVGPPTSGTAPPPPPSAPVGQPGSQVLARYSDGYLYAAVVIDNTARGAPRVIYADGSGEETRADRIFPDTMVEGTTVEVRDRLSEAQLSGTIVRRVDHAVEVRLADGSTRWFALADTRQGPPVL